MTDPNNDLLQRLLQHLARQNPDIPELMLDQAEVEKITGLSRATIHRLEKAEQFPHAIYVAPNRKRWLARDLAAWQRSLEIDNPYRPTLRGRGKGRRPKLAVVNSDTTAPKKPPHQQKQS